MLRWPETWGMAFNVSKCKVMHVGGKCYPGNKYSYTMNCICMITTKEERHWHYVSNNLKPGEQCSEAERRAVGVSNQISRDFHLGIDIPCLPLYEYVRQHLELVVQA